MEFQQNQLVVWSASYFDLFTAMLSILFVTYFYQLLINLINSTWSQRYGDKTKSLSQVTKKKWQIRSQNNRNTIIHPPLYQTISSSTNLCIQSAFKAAYRLVRVTPSTRVPRTAAHHLSRLLLVPMEKAFELSSLLSRISRFLRWPWLLLLRNYHPGIPGISCLTLSSLHWIRGRVLSNKLFKNWGINNVF